MAFAPAPGMAGELPVFDVHVHYSSDAWQHYDPRQILTKLDAAGVTRAIVSSTPDDGTVMLHARASARIVPFLRPYHDGVTGANWSHREDVVSYLKSRLERSIYRGIGEVHLADGRLSDVAKATASLAVERDLFLHVHADARPVRALFAFEPDLEILWAHAGMTEPARVVGQMLDTHPRLWVELSFREQDIAPDGRLDPAWRDLLIRHAERFMTGSDTYIASRWDEYAQIIARHRRWLVELPAEVAEAIAHGNAERLFGDRASATTVD